MKKKDLFMIILIFVVLIVVILSYFYILNDDKKNVKVERLWIFKHLTQCDEEWDDFVYDFYTKDNSGFWNELNKDERINKENQGIKKFYKEKGIEIYNIYMDDAIPEACEACNCLDDSKLFLLISSKDKNYFMEIGFS